MRPPPFPEQQRCNPFRSPAWRWDRANDLINTGRYLSRKRDDAPTGIAVDYLREINRCASELRLKRVRQRFRYVVQAHDIWKAATRERLEIETRILARQTDTEIGFEMNLPPETVQAWHDLFFHVRDRISATSYVTFQIIGLDPQRPLTPIQLMQLCVLHHGPHLIEPWFEYLKEERKHHGLETPEGRLAASLDLLLAVHSLSDDEKTRWSLVKGIPFLVKNQRDFSKSIAASAAFRKSTAEIISELSFPTVELEPCSYAPTSNLTPGPNKRQHNRQAA